MFFKGYHGDCSRTFPVGDIDDRGLQLIGVTEECLKHVRYVFKMVAKLLLQFQ